MLGATADLLKGPAEVVLIALDDLALDPQPHNVPGTTTERPNWQRRIGDAFNFRNLELLTTGDR